MLLGQEVGESACVLTLGSATAELRPDIINRLLFVAKWYVATDADKAGDNAAVKWPKRAIRVRPPGPYKDWTEAKSDGIDLARWWRDRMTGIESPELFT